MIKRNDRKSESIGREITAAADFCGYPPPTSNTTYTPNQYFDVVLPNASRGVARLVGYMIRRTLGWCDKDGNPTEPQALVSYKELEIHAGIARSKIRKALDEAIEARYIVCVRGGKPNEWKSVGYSGLFELMWDDADRYVTDPDEFNGFFSGNGNLTYIPNTFFDYTVRSETLAVVQVVGTIIRHTIGFQTKFGFRRQQIAMSFSEIQRRTGIVSRRTVSEAIHAAIDGRHIRRVQQGYFDPEAAANSFASTYSVFWRDNPILESLAEPKSIDGSKKIPTDHSPKDTDDGSKKIPRKQLQKDTDNTAKIKPETPPKSNRQLLLKDTDKKENSLKNSENRQVAAVLETIQLLLNCGIDRVTAEQIIVAVPLEQIKAQCEWLPLRGANKNSAGLLRKAIEENWPEPEPSITDSDAELFAMHCYAAMAGNHGKPVAYASKADIQAAERFLAAARGVDSAEGLGKRFGEKVRTSEQTSTHKSRSVVMAIRTWGDEYCASLNKAKDKPKFALADDTQAKDVAYLRFLAEQYELAKISNPAVVRKFERKEHERSERLGARNKTEPTEGTGMDREVAKLNRFAIFARQENLPNVPSFLEWERLYDAEPMNEERHSG